MTATPGCAIGMPTAACSLNSDPECRGDSQYSVQLHWQPRRAHVAPLSMGLYYSGKQRWHDAVRRKGGRRLCHNSLANRLAHHTQTASERLLEIRFNLHTACTRTPRSRATAAQNLYIVCRLTRTCPPSIVVSHDLAAAAHESWCRGNRSRASEDSIASAGFGSQRNVMCMPL